MSWCLQDEPLEDDGKRNSENEEEEEATESLEPNTILFVKNLNFDTTEESIKEVISFSQRHVAHSHCVFVFERR